LIAIGYGALGNRDATLKLLLGFKGAESKDDGYVGKARSTQAVGMMQGDLELKKRHPTLRNKEYAGATIDQIHN
jgi:hypothetical protein